MLAIGSKVRTTTELGYIGLFVNGQVVINFRHPGLNGEVIGKVNNKVCWVKHSSGDIAAYFLDELIVL